MASSEAVTVPENVTESTSQRSNHGRGANNRGGRGRGANNRGGRGSATSSRVIVESQQKRGFTSTFVENPVYINQRVVDTIRFFLQFHRTNISPRTAFIAMLIAHDETFRPVNLSNCSFMLTNENSDYRLSTNEACQVSSIYHILERRNIVPRYAVRHINDAPIHFEAMAINEN